MVEEGQPDPEFEAILNVVDPNRDGYVSLQEYMAFMISRETENVRSSEEVENAFRAITSGERPYVTAEELYAVSCFLQGYILTSRIVCGIVVYFGKMYNL